MLKLQWLFNCLITETKKRKADYTFTNTNNDTFQPFNLSRLFPSRFSVFWQALGFGNFFVWLGFFGFGFDFFPLVLFFGFFFSCRFLQVMCFR